MHVVISRQGAQITGIHFCCIDLYILFFAKAVVRNRGEHELILALSDLFPDSIESGRATFYGMLPQENIRVWETSAPVPDLDSVNCRIHETTERIHKALLASLQPNVIHVSNLFEREIMPSHGSVRSHTLSECDTLYVGAGDERKNLRRLVCACVCVPTELCDGMALDNVGERGVPRGASNGASVMGVAGGCYTMLYEPNRSWLWTAPLRRVGALWRRVRQGGG